MQIPRKLLLILTLSIVLLAASCGGSGDSPAVPEIATPQELALAAGNNELARHVVAVKMNPEPPRDHFGADPANTGISGLNLTRVKSELPQERNASMLDDGLHRLGDEVFSDLWHNVEFSGTTARFDPSLGTPESTTPPWALYRFSALGMAESGLEQTLGLAAGGSGAPGWGALWIGFGLAADGRWHWYEAPADGVLTLDSYAPYTDGSGNVLVALVWLGDEPTEIAALQAGQWESRGTGDTSLPQDVIDALDRPPYYDALLDLELPVDLRPGMPPVRDQGEIGSCTAFATVDSVFNYELGEMYAECPWDFSDSLYLMSPRYVYVRTGTDMDKGCGNSGRNTWKVGEWLLDNGIAPEEYAPYGTTVREDFDCADEWSSDAEQYAQYFNAANLYVIGGDDDPYGWAGLSDDDLDDLKLQLQNGNPVVMRVNLDGEFSDPDYAAGEAWTYNGRRIGGHAMSVVGYDNSIGDSGAVLVRNSWGDDWGMDGYCWISYETMQDSSAGVYAYTITPEWNDSVPLAYCDDVPSIGIPTDLLASEGLFDDYVEVSWNAVPDATGYIIYRDTLAEGWQFVGPQQTSIIDQSAVPGAAHIYYVAALDQMELPGKPSAGVAGWLAQ